jgi:hypothetical protein
MPRNSVVHADPIPSRAVPPPDPWMTSPITQRRRPPSAADPGRWAPGSVAPTSGWPVARYLLARRPHGEGGPRNVGGRETWLASPTFARMLPGTRPLEALGGPIDEEESTQDDGAGGTRGSKVWPAAGYSGWKPWQPHPSVP